VIEAGVTRDPADPGSEFGAVPEADDFSIALEEGFLGEILGVFHAADEAVADGEDAFGIAPDEFGVGLTIAAARSRHQGFVGSICQDGLLSRCPTSNDAARARKLSEEEKSDSSGK
jgi:hypothetical protein